MYTLPSNGLDAEITQSDSSATAVGGPTRRRTGPVRGSSFCSSSWPSSRSASGGGPRRGCSPRWSCAPPSSSPSGRHGDAPSSSVVRFWRNEWARGRRVVGLLRRHSAGASAALAEVVVAIAIFAAVLRRGVTPRAVPRQTLIGAVSGTVLEGRALSWRRPTGWRRTRVPPWSSSAVRRRGRCRGRVGTRTRRCAARCRARSSSTAP